MGRGAPEASHEGPARGKGSTSREAGARPAPASEPPRIPRSRQSAWLYLVGALLVCLSAVPAFATAADDASNPPVQSGAAAVGVKGQYLGDDLQRCALCHEAQVKQFLAHSRMAIGADPNTPMGLAGKGYVCEVCHGPSRAHVMNVSGGKRPPPPVVFGMKKPGSMQWQVRPEQAATPVKTQNAVCLTCHNDANHIHWAGSPHQFNGISCASCHNVMGIDRTQSKKTVAEVCFQCHKDIRADAHKMESHPILEGEVTCTNCHNPHGGNGGPHQLRYMTVNQTCYSCHADKRGPFLYQHPPVEENCTNCHNPHGTSFAFMLKRPVPFLCQQCHMAPYHPSTIYGPNDLAIGGGVPTAQLLARGCLNCHSHIHGSNDPNGGRWLR